MKTDIHIGDCRKILKDLPADAAYTCVTSPPYWGLRDYGNAGQLGLERSPEEYVENLVAVFREVKRVLRTDGTLWLNLGDNYAGYKPGKGVGYGTGKPHYGLKAKDLCGIPWRVAFALQADGWYLRSDIVWAKPSPMPESGTDRCTKAHEYIFMLTQSPKYYYDADAIREKPVGSTPSEESVYSKIKREQRIDAADMKAMADERGVGFKGGGAAGWGSTRNKNGTSPHLGCNKNGRNKRSVWMIASTPIRDAHFATFPPKLIEPCVLAGCPEGGTCLDPFAGSGTVGLVASRLQRNSILIEIDQDYAEKIAKKRIYEDAPMLNTVNIKRSEPVGK